MFIEGDSFTQHHLSDALFIEFRNFIQHKTGLFFKKERKKFLEKNIVNRLTRLRIDKISDYYELISGNSTNGKTEFQNLLEEITTRETSFFRNPSHFDALRYEIFPEIIRRKKNNPERSIRIWSAGCASGEEPYSIVFVLLGLIDFPETWNIQVLATDISENALQTANYGIYDKRTLNDYLDRIPQGIVQEYDRERYIIKKDVRQLIRFQKMNLINEVYLSNFDIIFCRNVIIYFSDKERKRLINYFYRCLRNQGYLFIGHSESLHLMKYDFDICRIRDALVYKKNN